MRQFLFILMALAMMLPVQAKIDPRDLLGGLLELGGKVAAEQTPDKQHNDPQTKPADQLILTLRASTDKLLETYKEEGRQYAREIGDEITQRMLESKKLTETLDSVRYLCWGVIAYLTVVTLLILILLLRLRILYSRLIKKLEN